MMRMPDVLGRYSRIITSGIGGPRPVPAVLPPPQFNRISGRPVNPPH